MGINFDDNRFFKQILDECDVCGPSPKWPLVLGVLISLAIVAAAVVMVLA